MKLPVERALIQIGYTSDTKNLTRLGEPSAEALDCSALQAVDDSNQDVGNAAVLELVPHAQPEFGVLGLLDPDTQYLLRAVGKNAEGDIHRLVPHEPSSRIFTQIASKNTSG